MSRKRFVENSEEVYRNGIYIVTREYGKSPNGNPFNGSWVVRVEGTGEYVEHSRYRHDLLDKYS